MTGPNWRMTKNQAWPDRQNGPESLLETWPSQINSLKRPIQRGRPMVLDQLHVIHTETYMLPLKPKKYILSSYHEKKKKELYLGPMLTSVSKTGFWLSFWSKTIGVYSEVTPACKLIFTIWNIGRNKKKNYISNVVSYIFYYFFWMVTVCKIWSDLFMFVQGDLCPWIKSVFS